MFFLIANANAEQSGTNDISTGMTDISETDLSNISHDQPLPLSCTVGPNSEGGLDVNFYITGDNSSSAYRIINALMNSNETKKISVADSGKTCNYSIRVITGKDPRNYTPIKESDGFFSLCDDGTLRITLCEGSPVSQGYNGLMPMLSRANQDINSLNDSSDIMSYYSLK